MSLNRVFAAMLALVPLGVAPQRAFAEDIIVTQVQLERLEIKLRDVRPATDEAIALLTATIIPPMNSRISVPAPFSGTVVSVGVLPGETVERGQDLMTITSRELLETLSQLRQAEAKLDAAEAIADRYRTLADKKIASPTRAAEAEAQREHARAVVEEHRRLISLGNIKTNPDGSYTLVAQRAGRIVQANVGPGASIEAMSPAVVLDTSDELWVEAQLPASLMGKVRPGDSIYMDGGVAGNTCTCEVLSVGHTLDPKTRSATLIGTIPASAGLVMGQMVTLSIHREAAVAGLGVPAQSVVWVAGTPSVFVRTGSGFTVLPVNLKGKTLQGATIEADLAPGQKVAVSGLAQLENMIAGE